MAEVKVRHALINYTVPGTDNLGNKRELDEIALRGQVVDIPDDQAERLRALGAVVDADLDLERPGVMMALPESPTDEEVIAWVRSARREEVVALAQMRPELVDRISGAMDRVERDYKRQMELLGHAVPEREREHDPAVTYPPSGGGGAPIGGDGGSGDPSGLSADEISELADSVVLGSVEEVSSYLADNPTHAQAVLDAETRHKNGKPRQGVVTAAQAAAGHA